jgi:hypothetical protein
MRCCTSVKDGVVDVAVLEQTWTRLEQERRPLSLDVAACSSSKSTSTNRPLPSPNDRLLVVCDAFSLPVSRYNRQSQRFEVYVSHYPLHCTALHCTLVLMLHGISLETKPSIHGSAEDRAQVSRQRLLCIQQRVTRNPRFRSIQNAHFQSDTGEALPLTPLQALLGTSHTCLVLATVVCHTHGHLMQRHRD